MAKVSLEYENWEELKKILEVMRDELPISATKITQILNRPGKANNEELIIIASALEVTPWYLYEKFSVGKGRLTEVEACYHKRLDNLVARLEKYEPKTPTIPDPYPISATG